MLVEGVEPEKRIDVTKRQRHLLEKKQAEPV
jgi:hypothetical protein